MYCVKLLNGIHHIWGDLISNDNQADDLVLADDDGADVGGAVDNAERDQRRDKRAECLNALSVVDVAMTGVTIPNMIGAVNHSSIQFVVHLLDDRQTIELVQWLSGEKIITTTGGIGEGRHD